MIRVIVSAVPKLGTFLESRPLGEYDWLLDWIRGTPAPVSTTSKSSCASALNGVVKQIEFQETSDIHITALDGTVPSTSPEGVADEKRSNDGFDSGDGYDGVDGTVNGSASNKRQCVVGLSSIP
jgi:hypothetical protein